MLENILKYFKISFMKAKKNLIVVGDRVLVEG